MDELLENFSDSLLDSIEKKQFIESKRIVTHLIVIFDRPLSNSEIDQIFFKLFNEENGIIYIFRKVSKLNKEFKDTIIQILNLFIVLINNFKNRVDRYINSIIDISFRLLIAESFAIIKENIINLFYKIFEYTSWTSTVKVKGIFGQLCNYCYKNSKLTPKVKGSIISLMGLMSKIHKDETCTLENRFNDYLLFVLTKTMRGLKTSDLPLVKGLLEGYTDFFVNASPSAGLNPAFYTTLYGHIKVMADPKNQRIKIAFRAALKLISVHGHLFSTHIVREYQWWHQTLTNWLDLSYENRKVGMLALNELYKVISDHLRASYEEENKEMFLYFFNFFKSSLVSNNLQSLELRLAIRGFGLFAGPCRIYLSSEDVSYMLFVILQRIDLIYLSNDGPADDDLEYLPNYIVALSEIMMELGEITQDNLCSLQEATVLTIKTFPQLNKSYHHFTYASLIQAIVLLYSSKNNILKDFISKVIYQGILWTCSHSIVIDTEIRKEYTSSNINMVTYKNYIPFWTDLIHHSKHKIINDKVSILSIIFDEFIESLMMIVMKLDLNIKKKATSDAVYCDLESGFEASNPKDFVIFVNVVDFYSEIAGCFETSLFERCVISMTQKIIKLSYKHSLISGFYKLVTTNLIILDKLNYFDTDGLETNNEKSNFLVLLNNYLEEILIKVKQCKGDLQISLFEVILASPATSMKTLMPLLNSVMGSVFIIGRSYYKLAFKGIDALDRWYLKLPYEEIEPLLKFLIPYLDIILRSKSFQNDLDIKPDMFKKSNKRNVAKKKIYLMCDSELVTLKHKIADFVGRLNSDLHNSLINTQEDCRLVLLKCNDLQFTVPFQDISLQINLDELIPRIVELAVESSDRKTRVTACEVLHTVVLIILGKSKQIQVKSNDFLRLFESIFLPLIRLGCDTDQVVQQLFNPLVLQIIHYYSSSFQFGSEETSLIIDTIIECITHPSDTKVRDFSIDCLNEFIEWSIKQQVDKNNATSLNNIEIVLKKICDLCFHPLPEKRLGAALAMNRIHKLVIKERRFINKFWIELLYSFLMNLSMLNVNYNEMINLSEHIQKSIDFIVSDIIKNKETLNKVDKTRRKPVVLDEANLSRIIDWIFHQYGRICIDYSRKCMEIFCKLASSVDNCTSAKSYICNFIQNTCVDDFLKIIEFSLDSTDHLAEVNNLSCLLKWFDRFLLSLDCYDQLLHSNLIVPELLFSGDNKIQKAIVYILDNAPDFNRSSQKNSLKEYREFDRLKCLLLVRIFDFTANVMKCHKQCKIWNELWCVQLWKVLSSCFCNPESMGFDLKNREIAENLPNVMKHILMNIKRYLNPCDFQQFLWILEKDLKDHMNNCTSIVNTMNENQISINAFVLLKNVITLSEYKFLTNSLPESSDLLEHIFNSVVHKLENSTYGVKINSSVHEHVEYLITLAFNLCDERTAIIKFITSNELIKDPQIHRDVTQGEYFFSIYSEVIVTNLIKYDIKSFELLLESYRLNQEKCVFKILIEILKHLHKNKHIKKRYCEEIASLTLSRWHSIVSNHKNVNDTITLLQHIVMIVDKPVNGLYNHSSQIDKWILNQLLFSSRSVDVLNYKIRLLDFLPCICGCSDTNVFFQKSVEEFIKIHFGIFLNNCTSLTPQSPEQINLILVFRKLLKAWKTSGSLIIFQEVIKMIRQFSDHLNEQEINDAFEFTMNRLNSEIQFKMIEIVYVMTFDEVYSVSERIQVLMKYLLLLLDLSNFKTIENFFASKMSDLMRILNMSLTDNDDTKNVLVGKVIVFSLVEILFYRFDSDYFESKSCPITVACSDNIKTGKELVKEIVKCSLTARKTTINSTSELDELFITYQCCAYKTLIAVISNTQVDVKKYLVLFYHEQDGRDILWEKIVDRSKNYTFTQDFDEYPSKRKQIINIRSRIRKENKDTDNFQHTYNVNYISTQNLFNSTLNEDVSRFDFSNVILKNQIESSASEVHARVNNRMIIELESNDLNDHECMACLCGLIRHITHLMENNEEQQGVPFWIRGIKKNLTNDDVHKNIKLFLLKLIENNQDIFKPYANVFFVAILKAITNETCGENLNYFNVDLINMILLWHTEITVSSEDKPELMKFLHFIVDRVGHSNKKLFKLHIELLKTIVEVWRNEIEISSKMFEYFSKENSEPLDITVVINICAIFTANKLKPWNSTTKATFFNTYYNYIRSDNREIYLPCSELLGMVFVMIDPDFSKSLTTEEDEIFFEKVRRHINLSFGSGNYDKVYYCLHGIHKYYPPFIDSTFTKGVMRKFKSISGDKFKIISMKLLASVLKTNYRESLDEIKLSFFEECLKEIEPEVQQLALYCLKEILDLLDSKLFLDVFPLITEFLNHKNSRCRSLMYDIMIRTFEKYESACEENFREIHAISKNILLFGLRDTDEEIQPKIFGFWSAKMKTSPDTVTRLPNIIRKLHSSSIDNYLGHCVYFILESTESSPNFKKNIFEHPLNFCEFREQKVLINWRAQNISLVPLFAETLASQINQTYHHKSQLGDEEIMIKATQSNSTFIKPATYIPMIKDSIQGTLLFTTGNNSESSFSRKYTKKETSNDDVVDDRRFVYRYRFLKSSTKLSKYFAMKKNEQASKIEESKRDYFKKNERNVTLYRNYRVGDFPDIGITNCSFIRPLQILVKQDEILARSLFTSLVGGFIRDIEDSNQFISAVGNGIKEVLDSTNIFSPNVVEPFLHLALKHSNIIDIPNDTIILASRDSGLLSSGCLLLEEKIIHQEIDQPICKRPKSEINPVDKNDSWIKLVELYKGMSESDVVKNIFVEKMGYIEVLEGLEHESMNEWKKARDVYVSMVDESNDPQSKIPLCLKDFYYEMCFKCFENLLDWGDLLRNINTLMPDYESAWTKPCDRDKLLTWLINAHLQESLPLSCTNKKQSDNLNSNVKILEYLNRWMSDKEKASFLKSKFSEQLAMFSIMCKQIEHAKYYIGRNKKIFLDDWSRLSACYVKPRFDKLSSLQRTADIETCLSLLETLNVHDYKENIGRVVLSWNNDMDLNEGKLMLTKDKVEYRKQFLLEISDKLKQIKLEDTEVYKSLSESAINMDLKIFDMAFRERNFYIARAYVKGHYKNVNNMSITIKLKMNLALSKYMLLKSYHEDDERKHTQYLSSLKYLVKNVFGDCNLCLNPIIHFESCEHKAMIYENLLTLVLKYPHLSQEIYKDIPDCKSKEELLNSLNSQCVNTLFQWMNQCKSIADETSDPKFIRSLANAYMHLFNYCKKYEEVNNLEMPQYTSFILKAMKLGNVSARDMFPCLLQRADICTYLQNDFVQDCDDVPVWMFIRWIPQLLSVMDGPALNSVKNILFKIASIYPQAIVYPFSVSKEKYSLESIELKEAVTRMELILFKYSEHSNFLNALSTVVVPEIKFKHYLTKLINSLKLPENQVKATYENIMNIFQPEIDRYHGVIYSSVKKLCKDKLSVIFKNNNSLESIENKLKTIVIPNQRKSFILKDYSPWLANYRSLSIENELEIPGQYTGDRMPLLQYHTRISSFSRNIQIMPSIRQPIKITIVGNDGKEYPFLNKFGEDLRQDQRIQQLFVLMNNILKEDFTCSYKNLEINTYQVIPLTTNLGIIQWIDDHKSLNEFLYGSKDEENHRICSETLNNFFKWLRRKTGNYDKDFLMYEQLCSLSSNEIIPKFRECVSEIPWDILRKAFWKMSATSVDFFSLRQNFSKSYATMCIAHWLLGIGDRHLSNGLVSLKDGRILGIDFGYAFGASTQCLPVPELIPFRLTPHIVNLMQPFNEKGILSETMAHCLRAFRKNHDLLLATMDVFINEPLLDWLEIAKIKTENIESENWYSKKKVSQCERKLQGVNPMNIIIEDLNENKITKNINRYVSFVKGTDEYTNRDKFTDEYLNVEEQIECLLSLATDYNILGRTYYGWQPWL